MGSIAKMADRETIVIGLNDIGGFIAGRVGFEQARNFLRTIDDAIDLLKEQEAVKPGKEHSSSGVTWWNVCGNCKTAINPNDKFCHECGKPILWEGR